MIWVDGCLKKCGNIRNEYIRGETEWSSFEEREAKAMFNWMIQVIFDVK